MDIFGRVYKIRRNMNVGKQFEQQIKDSIPEGVFYYRLKDAASSFGQDSTQTRFSLTNPFDFFMYKYPHLYAIENKSTATKSLSFASDKKTKGKNIKFNQITELKHAHDKGLVAGFLFNFREVNETYFMFITDFLKCTEQGKKSINVQDVRNYNGFLVPQKLKKVKYNYDITALIEHCEGEMNVVSRTVL